MKGRVQHSNVVAVFMRFTLITVRKHRRTFGEVPWWLIIAE
jgi:hypothetical protein